MAGIVVGWLWGFLLMSFEKTTPNSKHFFNNSDYEAAWGQMLTRGLLVGAALPAEVGFISLDWHIG